MSAISTYLEYIRSKIYAKDVRTAIVNAISQCYDDVNKPALQTEAMRAAVQAKIDSGQMAALTIADGSLTGAKLANGTIPTAKIADGAITARKIESALYNRNSCSVLSGLYPTISGTTSGISFSWNDGICTISGTATQTVIIFMVDAQNYLPYGFEVNETMYIEMNGINVEAQVFEYVNGTPTLVVETKKDTPFKLSENATGVIVRLHVYNGVTVNNEKIKIGIYNAISNRDLLSTMDSSLYSVAKSYIELGTFINSIYLRPSNGAEAAFPNYQATGFLYCHGFERIIATIASGSDGYAENAFYTKEKVFISSFKVPNGVNEITVPPNAYYCRFSNTTTAMNSLEVERGIYYDVEQLKNGETTTIVGNNKNAKSLIIQSARKYTDWDGKATVPNVLTFAVLTDIHGDSENLGRYIDFCNHYDNYIDEKLCLGDMVVSFFSSDITYWDNMTGSNTILRTIGNHDVWISYDKPIQNADKVQAYEKYYTGKTSNWGNIVQPSNAASNGYMYYYKDYSDQSVRLIVTDCMYWDSTENTWFSNVLEDARQNNLSVVCTSHYNLTSGNIVPIADFYSKDYDASHLVTAWATQARNAVDTFITNGGTFITWLSGDSHYDYCGVYTDPNSNNKQLSLTFENAWCNTAWNDSDRVKGTKTQDSFNIVSVDTYSKLIKVVRIGNSCDRYLRSKEYFVYDYDNYELVTSR